MSLRVFRDLGIAFPVALVGICSWSLIFGLVAATLFSLVPVPVLYDLAYSGSMAVDAAEGAAA